jgi:hypothetical protein
MSTTRISKAATRPGLSFEKILCDDALERFRQRSANLVLLICRENVDDTIDGFGSTGGVKCSENEVTRGGRG